MIKNILVAAAFGAVALGAHAAPTNLVVNGDLDGTTGSYVYNASPDSVTANYGGTVPVAAGTVSGWDGSFVSIASNSGPWGNPSSLAHFDAATQGGYVAGVQADGSLEQTLTLDAGWYVLSWSDANRGASQSYSVSFEGTEIGSYTTQGGWNTESVKFYTAGGTGALSFQGLTDFHATDATSLIDNASLIAVPEPASVVLMLVGMMSLVAWRRRSQI